VALIIGEYTLLCVPNWLATRGKCMRLKPHPVMHQYLKANVERNRLRRVTLNHAAVGDRMKGVVASLSRPHQGVRGQF